MPETPYVAVLQLTPPQVQGRLTITLTLHATDEIGSGQQRKMLRDCTLAELQQFADEIEQSFWSEYMDSTLQALLADDKVMIDIALDDGAMESDILDAVLLGQVVLLAPQTDTAEVTPMQDVVTDAVEIALEEAAVVDETGDEDADTLPEVVDVAHLPEPIITVISSAETPATESVAPPRPINRQLRVAGGVRSDINARGDTVDILLEEPPLRVMQAHAVSSMRREVAGVMIGPQPEKQPSGRYVVRIIDSIIAEHTRMSGASVTYTPESWRYVNDQLAEKYPDGDAMIVGWYHTHPGFGIFLSGMDLFIHENFFTQPWHVAYVLDPVARRSGFFCWDKPQKRVKEYDLPWPEWSRHSW
jgi:proteasome lid subunit RPN8/RPN11